MSNKNVDTYITSQKKPQKDILKKLRKILLRVSPKTNESFKNGVPWYEGKFYLVGLKDHVNMGFSIKGLNKNELKLFEGHGKLTRHIKIYDLKDIDEDQLTKCIKLIDKKTRLSQTRIIA